MDTKKIFKFSSLFIALFFILALVFMVNSEIALAASEDELHFDPYGTYKSTTDLGDEDPAAITYRVINYSLMFLGIITVAMIIVAGFMWMFAGGSEDRIKKAQDILKGALLGLLVIMASYGVSFYVFTQLVEITT